MPSKSPLLQAVRHNLRLRHFSPRTEATYLGWIRRYIRFSGLRDPRGLGLAEVRAFLTHLAVAGQLSESTVSQARAALLFLYRKVRQPWWRGSSMAVGCG